MMVNIGINKGSHLGNDLGQEMPVLPYGPTIENV